MNSRCMPTSLTFFLIGTRLDRPCSAVRDRAGGASSSPSAKSLRILCRSRKLGLRANQERRRTFALDVLTALRLMRTGEVSSLFESMALGYQNNLANSGHVTASSNDYKAK